MPPIGAEPEFQPMTDAIVKLADSVTENTRAVRDWHEEETHARETTTRRLITPIRVAMIAALFAVAGTTVGAIGTWSNHRTNDRVHQLAHDIAQCQTRDGEPNADELVRACKAQQAATAVLIARIQAELDAIAAHDGIGVPTPTTIPGG